MLKNFKKSLEEQLGYILNQEGIQSLKIGEFITSVEGMIEDPNISLEDIKEKLIKHFTENKGLNLDEGSYWDHWCMEGLIKDLDVNQVNYERILSLISWYHSLAGFERLIFDFNDFVSKEQRDEVIDIGTSIFSSHSTENWPLL